jgi:hypothetical protein
MACPLLKRVFELLKVIGIRGLTKPSCGCIGIEFAKDWFVEKT